MTLQAVIFDVVGTLAETETLHLKAMNRVLRPPASPSAGTRPCIASSSRFRVAATGETFFSAKCCLSRTRASSTVWQSGFITVRTSAYRAFLASGALELRPGVRRLIQEARKVGLRLAIATAPAGTI